MAIDTTSIGTTPRPAGPTPSAPGDPLGDRRWAERAPEAGAGGATTGQVRYRPALDGLRAVAVLAVLAYHWPATWMPGGFLGVEVFFVISGYLITSLLLGERLRTGGNDLKAFWLRRARRLLPALYALLAVVSGVWLIWHASEVAALRGAVVAAATYVSNWYLIGVKQSYFSAVGRPSPLLHLWSLAVEEQFYLIWPLALALILRLTRRRMRLVLLVVLALAALSAVLGMVLYHPGVDPFRVWYGTDTRAAGILLGAALAIAVPPWQMHRRVRRGASVLFNALGIATLVGVLWMFVRVNEFDSFVYRGGFVILDVITVGLIVALVHPAGTLVGRLLATKPMVWIGRRSYGIYIWHWPIYVLTRPGLDVHLPGWQLLGLRLGLTFGAAELSYRFIEMPVRNGALMRWLRGRNRSSADQGPRTEPVAGTAEVQWTTPAEPDRVPIAAALKASERSRLRVVSVALVGVVVIGLISVGLVQARTQSAAAIPGLDLRGVRHDKLGDVIDDGRDTGVPATTVAPPTTAATATTAPVVTTPPPPPPIVPIPGDQVIAIGDSVLLGARGWVREQFPGVVINAEVGRQFNVLPDIVGQLQFAGAMRPDVIIDLGTNGPPTDGDLAHVLTMLAGAHRVALVTTREPRSWQDLSNQRLAAALAGHPNVVLVDWHAASANHPEYFVSDGVHLTQAGGQAYAEALATAFR
jgi:peptidoglycan/LPS O-acetylase OafA/YrhL